MKMLMLLVLFLSCVCFGQSNIAPLTWQNGTEDYVLPVSLDFGTASSPVEVPYIQVTGSSIYDPDLGYGGWMSAVSSVDRTTGGPSKLERDFCRDVNSVPFVVELPNGLYKLTFKFWDAYNQGPFDVYVEGTKVIANYSIIGLTRMPDVSVADVNVIDGQLTIVLDANEGVFPQINGLTITPKSYKLYDFGQLSSGVMLGWTQVTKDNVYSSANGYGWSRVVDHTARTGVSSVLDGDLCRDLTGAEASFYVDVPNGRYDVFITVGDQYTKEGMDVYLEGNLVWEHLSYSDNEWLKLKKSVDVTDGQLTMKVVNPHSNPWVLNSMVLRPAEPRYCGDGETTYLPGDISGPEGTPDCYVNFYDLATLASSWVECTDPENSVCLQ